MQCACGLQCMVNTELHSIRLIVSTFNNESIQQARTNCQLKTAIKLTQQMNKEAFLDTLGLQSYSRNHRRSSQKYDVCSVPSEEN